MTGGYNGSGTFVMPYNWENDAASGILISAPRMDGQDGAIATGLSTAICKDGQTIPTANLPMGTFHHTTVSAGTLRDNYTQIGQHQDGGLTLLTGLSGAATNTIVALTAPQIPAYVTGQVFQGIPDANNTGDTTINILALGAIHILKNGATLGANDLQTGVPFSFMIVTGSPTTANLLSAATTPFVPTSGLQPNTVKTTQTSLASASTTDLGTIPSQNVLITGTTTITGFGSSANVNSPIYLLEFNNVLTLTYNATSLILPTAANITTASGDTAIIEYLGSGNWKIRSYFLANGKSLVFSSPPTRQYLTSSGTYTTPTNCKEIIVKMVGGGGGGSAVLTNAGSAGGNTIFNGVNASGGGGGFPVATGTGAIGGNSGSGSANLRIPGNSTSYAVQSGAPGPWGGGGSGQKNGAGGAAAANSGAGGGAGNNGSTVAGSGGASGEYVELIIVSPSSSYSYTIGAGGNGGAPGTDAGGNGGSGLIIVEEYY